MPKRKSDSWAATLAAVAVAFPYTNNVFGMYMRRRTPTTEARMYRSPAIRAFLLSEVMRTPDKGVPTNTRGPRESSSSLLRLIIVEQAIRSQSDCARHGESRQQYSIV